MMTMLLCFVFTNADLVGMILNDASLMEHTINEWKKPAGHEGHTATLDVGFYSGSGEWSINYRCSCGASFLVGYADPDLIRDEVWNRNAKK